MHFSITAFNKIVINYLNGESNINEHQTFPISQVIYNPALCYLEDSPHKARLSG